MMPPALPPNLTLPHVTSTFDLLHPGYCDTTGIRVCLPVLAKICRIVLEISCRKRFLWPICHVWPWPLTSWSLILYLHEQLRDHQVARTLQSTTAPLFYRPSVSTVFASQAFYYSAPQVWNCLGTSTRSANTFSSFRRCWKSELFAAAYDM